MANTQGLGFFDTGEAHPDLVIENGTLKADNSLETPSLISVYSNRRIEAEDLPPGITDQEGWWADEIDEVLDNKIGSRLWTLARKGKITDETINEMEGILSQAFDWMITDGIADTVTVETERSDTYEIVGKIEIKKPDGDNIPFKFIWDGQRLKLTAE